jgi:glycosyltransferase involved in cell wall biosynthesis
MLVSIITPSYNQASFLEETIQSVLAQDYPHIEYWVMDGDSKDGSVEIIRKYAGQMAGWVSEKDSGQAEAINKGLARATGDIVAWVNSDDYYMPGAVRAAVEIFERRPEVGLVYGDVVSINGAGEPFNVMTYGHWGLEDLMQFKVLGQPAVFMRRSIQTQAGLLDTSFDLVLDLHLFLKMAMYAPMVYVPERWAAARYHAGAKNIARAAYYGAEAYRLVDWMKAQPELQERYHKLRRRVWAGAHLYGAHYLQDGGDNRAALASILRGMLSYPPIGLRAWRRFLFALAGLVVNVDGLKESYLERRKRSFSKALDGDSNTAGRRSAG